MNNEFHQSQNYQKFNEYQFINNMFFGAKKTETIKVDNTSVKDLELVTKMGQEFAKTLDLKETLQTSLELIIKRINAQAANIFLIDNDRQNFQCIASKHQAYLEDFEIPITQGVMGKAALMKQCIRVGDVRKDVREIAEFYFDLDNKTNFTTYSVLCSPLIVSDECIGVIHCLNKKTDNKLFEESDRKLLETLSGPAALAIRNAKMAKDLIDKNRIEKEIESSLLMSKASSLYRCLSKTNFSAAGLLDILNTEICETTSRGMFVTMLVGIYDSNKKELTLSNAGHEPPLIYSKDGNFSNFEEAGPPLGIAPKFKFKETKINFSNSSMYIFTDGITEIRDAKGNMLEAEGFKDYIKKYQQIPNHERLNKIIEDIIKSGRIQKDDLTIVTVDG